MVIHGAPSEALISTKLPTVSGTSRCLKKTGDHLPQIKDKRAWEWFDVPSSEEKSEQKTLKRQMLHPTWILHKCCGYSLVLRSSGSSLLTSTKSSKPAWVSTFQHQRVDQTSRRGLSTPVQIFRLSKNSASFYFLSLILMLF